MKNIFILLFLWLLVGCQNMQNPPNISHNTESVARVETQNTESSKTVSQNNEVTAQLETQKDEKTEDDSSQSTDDCIFSRNNFCFSEWENWEKRPKVDLGGGVFLELSEEYVSLNIGEKEVDSVHFRDFYRGVGNTLWYEDMDFEKCEAELGKKEIGDGGIEQIEERCPQLFRETVKNAVKNNLYYRASDEWAREATNAPDDILFIGGWVYEFSAPVYIFDKREQRFLMVGDSMGTWYVYKDKDFVVIQDSGSLWNRDAFDGIYFFFNNGSTIKIPSLTEGKMKSVKVDGNKVHFTFNCEMSNEECKNQGNEIKITKTFEELFGLSEK